MVLTAPDGTALYATATPQRGVISNARSRYRWSGEAAAIPCRIVGSVAEASVTPTLTDGIVVLREFVSSDASALTAIWSDPAIRARNSVPQPTPDAARAWVQEARRRNAAGEAWDWAIIDAESGLLAGRRALKDICWEKRRAVATTWVAPSFRGRRFAGRSLRLAAAHAFQCGLVRVHAEVETDNHASIRSVLAAGMRHEGTLRAWYVTQDGEPLDLHVFGLLPGDLRPQQPARTCVTRPDGQAVARD
ncbi:MAG: hypothetical protein QOK49_1204 [Baekduia sp.]|jgi:RimJ/RimL family protein N-acetyltransferase|nr:hypothetical protein [Baekduia sp.]